MDASSNARKPAAYWSPYAAGVGLGLVLAASFVVAGRGLGASGALTRLAVWGADKAEVMARGGTGAGPGLVASNTYAAALAGPSGDVLDDFLVFLAFGVVVGGFASALAARRFSFSIVRGPRTTDRRRLLFAVAGGLVSAFGTRLARGCTSGQALAGGATLAVGSWVFMLCVFAAGYALAWLLRKEWL
jgi:hypothetical protein